MKKRILSIAMTSILCLSLLPNVVFAAEKPSSWAEADVNKAIETKLVPETLQTQYTQAATRAEFTALVVALYESVTGSEITERTKFNDTSDINVEKAAAIGVVSGTGNDAFSPNTQLTREQAATMLARLSESVGKPLTKQAAAFSDNSNISSWATEAVGQMQASGIMGGVGENAFAPQGDYTREQSIVTILRLYEAVKGGAAQTTAPAASYKDYGISSLSKIPDFGEVANVKCIGEKVEAYTTAYYYTFRYSVPEAGWVKKYDEAISQAGFEWGPYNSAKTEEGLAAHENRTGEKRNINWKDANDSWVYLYSKAENGAGESYIDLRISVPIEHLTSKDVYSTIQTFAQEKGYKVYDKYPDIPDFGALFGVEPQSAEPGLAANMFTYRYDMGDINESAREITNSSYTSGIITTNYYENILKECGFTEEIRKSNGGKMLTYWEGYNYSIRIMMSGEYDVYKNRINQPFTYSIIIQKL